MTFNEQLTVTLIDKLAIGMVVLLAGFWLNRALKDFEGKQALRKYLQTGASSSLCLPEVLYGSFCLATSYI